MKKSVFLLSSLLLAGGVFVGGCKNANGPDDDIAPAGVTNEEQAMKLLCNGRRIRCQR